MEIDFLTILDESNSIKDNDTGEITLICSKYETDKSFIIKSKCKITSNCNSVIESNCFKVSAQSVHLNNLIFETSFKTLSSHDLQIEDCKFKNPKSNAAIEISASKSVSLKNITITDINSVTGLIVSLCSDVFAQNLLICGSMQTLIICNKISTLLLCDSTIYNSKNHGIAVYEKSKLELNNCSIYDTEYPAIYIQDSQGKIINNVIENIILNGLVLSNSESFEISNNKFNNIKGSAISIIDNSIGNINHNFISNIKCNGIYISNHSDVKIFNNVINETKYPGVAILMKSKAKLYENKIQKINSCGIRCIESDKVEIENNEIKCIQECGISISDTPKCIINTNNISDCQIAAVEAYNNSKATISNNDLSNIKEYAFLVYTSANIKVENNTIQNIGKSMANLIYKGGGDFINNKITKCPNQIDGKTSSKYFFNGNNSFSCISNEESKQTENNIAMCIKCGQNPRSAYLFNCGHDVYCTNCAEEALQNHEKCPLCRLPIFNFMEYPISKEEICIICKENKSDTILMPCGHISYCHKCLEQWFRNNRRCPYCQKVPVSFRIISDL